MLLAGSAQAQVYRCGSTWSQVPCGPDAQRVVNAPAAGKLVPAELRAADLPRCHDRIREVLVDPESARFAPPVAGVEVDGQRQYVLNVNAKNRMGGYNGPRQWLCTVSAATGQVLSVN